MLVVEDKVRALQEGAEESVLWGQCLEHEMIGLEVGLWDILVMRMVKLDKWAFITFGFHLFHLIRKKHFKIYSLSNIHLFQVYFSSGLCFQSPQYFKSLPFVFGKC